MDKKVLIVGVVLIVIQMTRAQPPNLAALLGLEGFGNLFGNMGGGGGGGQQQSSGSASCPYTAHADRKKFNWNVNGRNHVQDCPPGTMYVQSKCSCDNVPQGATANGPMPGSNPRLESSPGGGANSNPMIAALMSQLDAAFGGPSRAPRPSPRNNSPMNTNELNSIRHKITSGIRPGSMNQAPREPSRGSSRPQTRNQNNGLNRALPKPSGGPPGGDPMAALMASLGGLGGGGPNIPPGGAAGIGAGAGGNANSLPAVMATLNGGTTSSNDLALLAGLASGGGASLLRAPGSTSYLDMTNFFNAQGLMQGAAGGLSGMNNLDYLKLHTLDRHEVIDMGDLTPAGLLAANSHFANIDVPPYIPSGSSALAMAALSNAARGNRGNNAPPAIFG